MPKNADLEVEWLKFAKEIEADKLYYFMLAKSNKQDGLIIKTPAGNKERKAFLGYEWSSAKGNEGIKYLSTPTLTEEDSLESLKGINQIITPLFNPQDLNDETKLNYLVRQNILGQLKHISEDLSQHATLLPLTDMLDFSRVEFDKAIRTTIQKKVDIKSKYPLVRLGDFLYENPKSTIKVRDAQENYTGAYPFYTSGLNIYRFDDYLVDGENIYLSTGGNAIVQFFDGKASYSTDTYVLKSNDDSKLLTKFMYYYLNEKVDYINTYLFKGAGLKHLQKKDLKNEKIPLPPLEIQQQIIAEFAKIDEECDNAHIQISQYQEEIGQIFNKLEQANSYKITPLIDFPAEIKKGQSITAKTAIDGDYKVVAGGKDFAYTHNEYNREPNTITISASGANAGFVNFWEEEIFASDCTTVRASDEISTKYIFNYLQSVQEDIFKLARGAAQPHVYPDDIKRISIPQPPLEIQQQIVTEVSDIEAKIAQLKTKIERAQDQKKEVLSKYL